MGNAGKPSTGEADAVDAEPERRAGWLARLRSTRTALAARLDGGHRGKGLSGKARDRYAALQSGGEPQHINVPEARRISASPARAITARTGSATKT
jgi:hypothetical protein